MGVSTPAARAARGSAQQQPDGDVQGGGDVGGGRAALGFERVPVGRRRQLFRSLETDGARLHVPADRVGLLYTLYLPDGFTIGMRFTSLNVAAS